MNDDLISRAAAIDAVNHICPVDTEYDCTLLDRVDVRCVLLDLPSAEQAKESTYAQNIGKCETCCYWGNRMILRDGSLGDCGNFEKNLSKDFYCAWWSQKEKGDEQDG